MEMVPPLFDFESGDVFGVISKSENTLSQPSCTLSPFGDNKIDSHGFESLQIDSSEILATSCINEVVSTSCANFRKPVLKKRRPVVCKKRESAIPGCSAEILEKIKLNSEILASTCIDDVVSSKFSLNISTRLKKFRKKRPEKVPGTDTPVVKKKQRVVCKERETLSTLSETIDCVSNYVKNLQVKMDSENLANSCIDEVVSCCSKISPKSEIVENWSLETLSQTDKQVFKKKKSVICKKRETKDKTQSVASMNGIELNPEKVNSYSETLANSCIEEVVSNNFASYSAKQFPPKKSRRFREDTPDCKSKRVVCKKRETLQSSNNTNCHKEDSNFSDPANQQTIRKGATFCNFNEFSVAYEEWKEKNCQLFRLVESKRLKVSNEESNSNLRFRKIVYNCANYGNLLPKNFDLSTTSADEHPHFVSSNLCKARLILNYCSKENVLKVTTLNTRHRCHVTASKDCLKFTAQSYSSQVLDGNKASAKENLQDLCKKRLIVLNLWHNLEEQLIKKESGNDTQSVTEVIQPTESSLLKADNILNLHNELKVGAKFDGFDRVCEILKNSTAKTGFSFRIFSSKALTSQESWINEKMRYRYLLYRCAALKKRPDSSVDNSGKKIASSANYYFCSAMFSLLYSKEENVLYINKANLQHCCRATIGDTSLNNNICIKNLNEKSKPKKKRFAKKPENGIVIKRKKQKTVEFAYDLAEPKSESVLELNATTDDAKCTDKLSYFSLPTSSETTDCNLPILNTSELITVTKLEEDSHNEKAKVECVVEIQRKACRRFLKQENVSLCLDCSKIVSTFGMECRFKNFRQFIKIPNKGGQCFAGFVKYRKSADGKEKFHTEFLPPPFPKIVSMETACYVLKHIQKSYQQILTNEKQFLSNLIEWKFLDSSTDFLPWRDVRRVREMCDVCQTTLFNLHLICKFCGFATCPDCVNDRVSGRTKKKKKPLANRDNFGWYLCTVENKPSHEPSDLHLVQLIPDPDSQVLSLLSYLKTRLDIQLERFPSLLQSSVITTNIDSSVSLINNFESVQHGFYFNGNMLILNDVNNADNLTLFQKHWQSCLPVLARNSTGNLNHSIWTPIALKEKCLSQSSPGSIVDCRLGAIIDNFEVSKFWDGFVDCQKRLRALDGRKLYLKLKDWPPAEKFSNVLPEHYEDFCNSLPIPEYTHPKNGRFNLATNLPAFCVEPDLGPKLYCAYDMIFEPTRGTTNLHMDISCAVNVLVSVTTPSNVNATYLYNDILKHLELQDLDPRDLERAKRNPDQIGALWSIFRPQDLPEIRDFLLQVAAECRMKNVDDPIHDQMTYLNVDLRHRLAEDWGVKGFTFVQMLGDAVFIPAGAAHQVQNMLCCIKVAEDFVSPEGVSQCALVTDEFRSLTTQHNNHEDKLQLPNIILHSVRHAVRNLELNEPEHL